ncbi:MAG: potassium transporter KefB [Bacteroidetes bacterium]|nr:potassium transporter KefB [Bacteroidota bacterium]
MQIPILREIVIILGFSVLLILAFQRLKLPALLGFLVAGIVAGPHGLNLIQASHEVELLAEIGIIFLLFVIGIEFSLKGLSSIKNVVLWGGLLQVGGTILVAAGATYLLGIPIRAAIFMGFLLSLSSTAIVLKMLQEKGELASPHGRVAMAMLIFQDIVVVPMMLLVPILAGEAENPLQTLGILVVKVVLVVGLVIVLARYAVPGILRGVVKTKSRELFILCIVVICLATAWLTSSVGLSLALGAFFAGLIISESEYSHQATANILPFREIFISFFFVSIGMLLDIRFFFDHLLLVLAFSLAVTIIKIIVIALATLVLRYPPRTALLTGLSLFQVGEFAFLLAASGMEFQLLPDEVYQYFLAISIITMGVSPFVIAAAPKIASRLLRAPMPLPLRDSLRALGGQQGAEAPAQDKPLHDHLVIIGFGLNGENVAKAARNAGIDYIIVELDPEAIDKARSMGEPVVFGDATDSVILQHVAVQNARVVVVAISAPDSTHKIIRGIRDFTETAYIIVRTRYTREIEENLKHGADEVIPEEFETSIEIFTRVLRHYLVAQDEIQAFVNQIRSSNYEMLRMMPGNSLPAPGVRLQIPDAEIATLPVYQGNNAIVGKSVGQSGLRNHFGVTILAIRRGDAYVDEITPETMILPEDVLYVFGKPENVVRLNKFFCLN